MSLEIGINRNERAFETGDMTCKPAPLSFAAWQNIVSQITGQDTGIETALCRGGVDNASDRINGCLAGSPLFLKEHGLSAGSQDNLLDTNREISVQRRK